MGAFKVNSTIKAFGGYIYKLTHKSAALGGLDANLNIFIPARKDEKRLLPVLYYLGGLTCTGDNGEQLIL
jgi:S-formylglutathione hydrolase